MHLTTVLLLSALGVSAHPSGHAHLHRHAHQKRSPIPKPDPAVGDIVTATIEGKVVTWTNTYDGSPFVKQEKPAAASSSPTPSASPAVQAAAVAASSASTPAASPDSGSSSGGNGAGVTSFTAFCSGASKNKRATAAQIAYTGNTGTPGHWGCNIMLVANAETAAKYDYTAKFYGAKTSQSCACFNKIGPDGGINGFWTPAISWTLAPGAVQYVAFDANSQGGCICNSGSSMLKTKIGQMAGTCTEWDFANASNGGWSGADASALVPAAANAAGESIPIEGLKVCSGPNGSGTCSTINAGGSGTNAYLGGMEDLDGVGLNLPAGKVQLDIHVNY